MREGIYINEQPKSESDLLTGFVVFFDSGLKVSPFSSCTFDFIKAHAKARGVDGPVYVTTQTPNPRKV